MLVDLQWVRMAKKRLAMIDYVNTDDIKWISNGEQVVPVKEHNNRNESNTGLAEHGRFEVKASE